MYLLQSTTETDCLTKNLNSALDTDVLPNNDQSCPVFSDKAHRKHATSSTPISSTAAVLAFFGWNVLRPGRSDPVQDGSATDTPSSGKVVPDVLRCRICDRKLGLWAFRRTSRAGKRDTPNSEPKALDVLLEHREFCPLRTLAGGTVGRQGEGPWWNDAAVLHETQTGASLENRGTEDSGAQAEQNGFGTLEDRNSLGEVVDVLKNFIRPDQV